MEMNMLKVLYVLALTLLTGHAAGKKSLQQRVSQALDMAVQTIKQQYAYLPQKNINWPCIESHYPQQIPNLKNTAEALLFFEFFLHEFTDSHMTLNSNIDDSYRLYAPLSVHRTPSGFMVQDVWFDQLAGSTKLAVGDQLLSINGRSPQQVIEDFPAPCLDKSLPANQQWIINKALAGRHSQPRKIELGTAEHKKTIDLDQLTYQKHEPLLTTQHQQGVGIIRLNNSLGQTALIAAFDQALQELDGTKGLIIDLRNTISGGDSYIARAIMGRFISTDQAYQKHLFQEQYGGGPAIPRFWTEYVRPRPPIYTQPVLLLTSRWTGSMGEGLTIGMAGMGRAEVVGTPMAGLLGAVDGFQLPGLDFGFQMPVEQLFHADGTPRELFKPDHYVHPKGTGDHVLNQALNWLQNN